MGTRGRLPTSREVLKRRGSWRAKLPDQETLQPKRAGPPRCPTWLSAEGKAEWKRVARELPDGWLTVLDRGVMAIWCQSWSEWLACSNRIDAEGLTVTMPRGGVVAHPLLAVRQRSYKRLAVVGPKLGLDPSSRLRLKMPVDTEKVDAFDAFVAAGKSKARFFPKVNR